MDLSLWVGIIGAVISVVGTFITIIEARKAKASANKAQILLKTIQREQGQIALSKLYADARNIMISTIKLTTPSNSSKKLSGVNSSIIVTSVRTFIDNLKENCHHLPTDKIELVEATYKEITQNINNFLAEDNQSVKNQFGDQIHEAIGDILKIIKRQIEI